MRESGETIAAQVDWREYKGTVPVSRPARHERDECMRKISCTGTLQGGFRPPVAWAPRRRNWWICRCLVPFDLPFLTTRLTLSSPGEGPGGGGAPSRIQPRAVCESQGSPLLPHLTAPLQGIGGIAPVKEWMRGGLKENRRVQSSSRLKIPCFSMLRLHSGHRQERGSFSNGSPAGIPFFLSPFAGS